MGLGLSESYGQKGQLSTGCVYPDQSCRFPIPNQEGYALLLMLLNTLIGWGEMDKYYTMAILGILIQESFSLIGVLSSKVTVNN